jgi:hypothetical protein
MDHVCTYIHKPRLQPTQELTLTIQATWKVSQAVTTDSEHTKGVGLVYSPLIFGPVNVYRYHGMPDNSYPYPCDDDEKIRLDKMQYAVRTVYGGNVIAPISEKPTLILDLGTGLGYSLRNISNKRCLGN